jgi:uncharacterized RDD family membrane protein YckC
VTHPAEQQPPAPGYAPPPVGYSVPPAAVAGYGYPPGYAYPPAGVRRPGPVGPGGAPLAEFWQRLVAYIIDGLIVGAALLIPTFLLFGLVFVPYIASLEPGTAPNPVHFVLLYVLLFAIIVPLNLIASYVYFVRMCHRAGQTIGKRVMKIRVIRAADGGPIDLRSAKRRWLVQHVSAIVAPYFSWADGLWLLWDQPYRQCLHDKCAETVVVQVAA